MKTLLYENCGKPKYISVISILQLAAAGGGYLLITLRRECYIFASKYLYYDVERCVYQVLGARTRLALQ